jgi:hypothetical protein
MKPYFRKAGNPASHTHVLPALRRIPGRSASGDRARGLRDHQSAAGDFLRQCGSGGADRRSTRAGHRGRAAPAAAAAWPDCSVWRRRGVPRAFRSDRSRQPGQRRGTRAAGARRLHQLDAGLSLHGLKGRSIRSIPPSGRSPTSRSSPGEQLVGAGPVAAGDTVRWIIGDTESGSGATRRSTSS